MERNDSDGTASLETRIKNAVDDLKRQHSLLSAILSGDQFQTGNPLILFHANA